VGKYQAKQKEYRGGTSRKFEEQETVYAKNMGLGAPWMAAVVSKQTGPVSYRVVNESGQTLRRHVDQMRTRKSDGVDPGKVEPVVDVQPTTMATTPANVTPPVEIESSVTPVRHSARISKPPEYLRGRYVMYRRVDRGGVVGTRRKRAHCTSRGVQ